MTITGGPESPQSEKTNKEWKRRDRATNALAFGAAIAQCVEWLLPELPTDTLVGLLIIVAAIIWLHGHRHLQLAGRKVIFWLFLLSLGCLLLGIAIQGIFSSAPKLGSPGSTSPQPSSTYNHTPEDTSIGEPNQNLIDQKHLAEWETSYGERIKFQPRPANEENKGYAKTALGDLEDGSSGEGAALVSTPWKPRAWTRGGFLLTRPIKATDRFLATVGMAKGTHTVKAIFRVECLGGSIIKPIIVGEIVDTRDDNKLATFDQPLHNCVGAKTLRLYTLADERAADLVWVTAQIRTSSTSAKN